LTMNTNENEQQPRRGGRESSSDSVGLFCSKTPPEGEVNITVPKEKKERVLFSEGRIGLRMVTMGAPLRSSSWMVVVRPGPIQKGTRSPRASMPTRGRIRGIIRIGQGFLQGVFWVLPGARDKQ